MEMSLEIIREEINTLKRSVPRDLKSESVVAGLGYTAVKLETWHLGVSATLLSEITTGHCGIINLAGTLKGRKAFELADLAFSWDVSESSVGVAAINSLSQFFLEEKWSEYKIVSGNFIDILKIEKGEKVTMIGNIEPFQPFIRRKTEKFYVLERNPALRGEKVLPDYAVEEILPGSDIVIVTGSSIVNKTIGRILQLANGAREIAIVGPTASMVPDPLFKRGVTILSGMKTKTEKVDAVLNVIAEGGGTKQFKHLVEFINILK